MTTVDYTCRLCGKAGAAKAPDNFDTHTHGKWVAMLCHDWCYDLWSDRRRIEEKLSRACCILERVADLPPAEEKQARAAICDRVTELTKKWSLNAAKKLGSKILYWSPDVVEVVMENPAKWTLALVGMREMVNDGVRRETT